MLTNDSLPFSCTDTNNEPQIFGTKLTLSSNMAKSFQATKIIRYAECKPLCPSHSIKTHRPNTDVSDSLLLLARSADVFSQSYSTSDCCNFLPCRTTFVIACTFPLFVSLLNATRTRPLAITSFLRGNATGTTAVLTSFFSWFSRWSSLDFCVGVGLLFFGFIHNTGRKNWCCERIRKPHELNGDVFI